MRRYPSAIVGLPYPNRDGVPCHLVVDRLMQVGDAVDFERVPDHPHDPDAVAVWGGGAQLGYVPAAHRFIGEQLDRGGAIEATILDIERVDGLVRAVRLAVDLPSSDRVAADFT